MIMCVNIAHRLLCEANSQGQEFMGKLRFFHPEMISAQFLWGNVCLWEELKRDVKNSILKFLREPSI